MGAITQLAEKCRKCPFVDKCDHKKMEHLAYYEPMVERAIVDAGMSAEQPVFGETMQINVGGVTAVYKDEIEKELYKALREPPMLRYFK